LSILSRYLIREFSRLFSLCLCGGVVLYLVIDLFDRVERVIRYGTTAKWVFLYLLIKIPLMLYQMIPAAMLLAVLLTLGILGRQNEVLAMRTSGVPVWRIAYPFLLSALVISLFSFLLGEFVVPTAYQRSERIWQVEIKKQGHSGVAVTNRIWFKGEDWIYEIATVVPSKNELQGITLFEIGRPFHVLRRVDAARADWEEGRWVFYDGVERTFKEDGSMETANWSRKPIALRETPEDFREVERETEEMPISKLRTYIRKVAAEGYDPTPYRVELQKKIAYPVLNLVTVFLGIPFAIRFSRHGGIAMGVGISVVLGFVYWVFFAVTVSVGRSGLLPPVVAAWSANALFGGLGTYLLLRVEEKAVY
jgi:lipopolysaccharide export system permease protein